MMAVSQNLITLVHVFFFVSVFHYVRAVPLDPDTMQEVYPDPSMYTSNRIATARGFERNHVNDETLPPPMPRRQRRNRRNLSKNDFRSRVQMMPPEEPGDEPIYLRPEPVYLLRPPKRHKFRRPPRAVVHPIFSAKETKDAQNDKDKPYKNVRTDTKGTVKGSRGEEDFSNDKHKEEEKGDDEKIEKNTNGTVKSERSQTWTPKEQDSIVSGWFRAIGSIFSSAPRNASAAATSTPSQTNSTSTHAPKSKKDSQAWKSKEQSSHDVKESEGESPSTAGYGELSEDDHVTRRSARQTDAHRYHRRQPRGRSNAHGHDEHVSRASSDTEADAENADETQSREYEQGVRSSRIRRRANRNEPSAHQDANIIEEMPDPAAVRPRQMEDATELVPREAVRANGLSDIDDPIEPISDDPLSKTETREMVLLFKRLFTTLAGILDNESDPKRRVDLHAATLSDVRLTIAEAERMNRQRDTERQAGVLEPHLGRDTDSGEDGEEDSEHDRVSIVDTVTVRKGEVPHAREELRNSRRAALIDDDVADFDADEVAQGVPRSSPSFGARKKLEQAKQDGPLGEVYDSLTTGLNSML